jgi:hypothetical protein
LFRKEYFFMDEYISREAAVDAGYLSDWYISSVGDEPPVWTDAHIDELLNDFIVIPKDIPATDVQPVNQWISVKDRLPESEKEVLVWYRYTWGDAPTSYGFGINRWYSNTKQWRDGCLLKGVEILYWQPLPEPPKDGDNDV